MKTIYLLIQKSMSYPSYEDVVKATFNREIAKKWSSQKDVHNGYQDLTFIYKAISVE